MSCPPLSLGLSQQCSNNYVFILLFVFLLSRFHSLVRVSVVTFPFTCSCFCCHVSIHLFVFLLSRFHSLVRVSVVTIQMWFSKSVSMSIALHYSVPYKSAARHSFSRVRPPRWPSSKGVRLESGRSGVRNPLATGFFRIKSYQ